HSASPDLPFAARLGFDLARSRGDVPKLLEWLRRQREAAKDPIVRALGAVREAFLTADNDPEGAARCLSEAVEARPDDVALRELEDRMSPVTGVERGRWRERVAEQVTHPRTRSWLLLEAATEYERGGAPGDALRAAEAAAEAGGSELARVVAHR